MVDTAEAVVSVLAVCFTVAFAWPQVFRGLHHGVDGVSVGAITQSLVSASAWLGYGLAERLLPMIIADVGVVSGQLIVTLLLVRNRALAPGRAVAIAFVAAGLIGLSLVPGLTTPIVVIAGIVGLTSAITQLVQVVREPHRLEGLSAGTYGLLTVMAVCWVAYGVLRADPVIIGPNLIMIPIASYVAGATRRAHHERTHVKHSNPPCPVGVDQSST